MEKNVKIGDRVIINTLAKDCSFLPKLETTVTFIYEEGNLFDCIEDNGKVHEAISFDNCKIIEKEDKKYLFVTVYDIEWEVDEEENTNLPINVIIPNRFLARDYVTKSGLLNKAALAEDVADYLSDCYGYLIRETSFHVEG